VVTMSENENNIRVIFVNDDKTILDAAKQVLENAEPEIEIISASTTEEVIHSLEDVSVDMIIVAHIQSDKMIHDLSGLLREGEYDIPIIIMSDESDKITIDSPHLEPIRHLPRVTNLREQMSELSHIIINSLNISRAETRLEKANEQYRRLFDFMPGGIARHKIVVDEKGKPIDYIFLEVNQAFEKLTGLKREDIIGKRVTEAIPDISNFEFDWISTYGEVALTGEPKRFEQYMEPLRRWYAISAYSIERGYFITAFTEITERKMIEEMLRERSEFLSEFVHSMAHDLRGSLHNIMGYAELLNENYDSAYVDKITQLAKGQSEILERSVELADAGLIANKSDKIDLDDLIRTLSQNIIPDSIKYKQEELPEVMGDRQRVRQVFTNIFENAIQHGNPSKIQTKAKKVDDGWKICICNNGGRIPEDDYDKIFKRGFTTKRAGKGLGLAIVQRIVYAHGWNISVESNKLTCFCIHIPNE
jgi:PAS domain S-box-containing protein